MTPQRRQKDALEHLVSTVTQAMCGAADLDQFLYVVLSGAIHPAGMGFGRAFLFLADDEGRELHFYAAVGASNKKSTARAGKKKAVSAFDLPSLFEAYRSWRGDRTAQAAFRPLSGFVVPLSVAPPTHAELEGNVPIQVLIARCVSSREAFFLNDVEAHFQPPPAAGGEALTFSRLAVVPLMMGDAILGVLLSDNAFQRRLVGKEEMRGLGILGNLAAIAIDRARLCQRMKEMSALDGLTGVFNRRHFELRFQQEMLQAKRAGRPLSLLLFNIDQFRKCNELKGYECGDRVLKELATLLRDRVRIEDVVARYGGEEFAVLLTGGATSDEALKVAEKLRQEVSTRSLGGCPTGFVTVSVGVSCQSSDALGGSELFQSSSLALTKAKSGGRNQVVLGS
jgi:diguanylate cyclase (GGDEF)-like protein